MAADGRMVVRQPFQADAVRLESLTYFGVQIV
jgi:hypothetical protein